MGMLRNLSVLAVAGLLAGCGGSSDFSDLQAYMDEVDARPAPPIEPLPIFEQVEPFRYMASTERSPFEPPVLLTKAPPPPPGSPEVKPNFNRAKEYLEQYSIASLTMVGTLAREQSMFALIKDADGGVHRVEAGDYIGTDHGEIQRIDEASIELIEIVRDGGDGWVRRERTVNLGGGGNRG
jgi:type IV pilus assembly protein PilP